MVPRYQEPPSDDALGSLEFDPLSLVLDELISGGAVS
jgi:hypothetical protein